VASNWGEYQLSLTFVGEVHGRGRTGGHKICWWRFSSRVGSAMEEAKHSATTWLVRTTAGGAMAEAKYGLTRRPVGVGPPD
jgi:hypothetical protein